MNNKELFLFLHENGVAQQAHIIKKVAILATLGSAMQD